MTDVPSAPYVWLAPSDDGSSSPARAPFAEHERIRAWAWARGVSLLRPASAASPPPVDPAIENSIEDDLGKARDALAALDVAAIEAALGHAEGLLRDHPELPQAPWLRAEVERGYASRFARVAPKDEARATRAWKRAAALDGGRVAGVGETAHGAADVVKITLRFQETPGLVVTIDGRTKAVPGTLELGEGDHHVIAHKRGRFVWAGWVAAENGGTVELPSFADAACSEADFANVRASARGDIEATGVACARWFVIRGGMAAQCRGGRCGALVPLESPKPAAARTPAREPANDTGPAWLPWTAIGIGAVLAGTALVYSSGAFDKPERQTRFVNGGLKTE